MKNRLSFSFAYPLLLLIAALSFGGCSSVARKDPISIFTPQVDPISGKVVVNGVDPNRPHKPFTWSWGDGHTEIGWFPLSHIYEDTSREYVLTITAYYDDGQTAQERSTISFKKKTA